MLAYNETFIGTVYTAKNLITILTEEIPQDAAIEILPSGYSMPVEVWYDKEINVLVFK